MLYAYYRNTLKSVQKKDKLEQFVFIQKKIIQN